jgi:ElaB/YqjD/DUF883 family membrane-anchored ribosome-binding protein
MTERSDLADKVLTPSTAENVKARIGEVREKAETALRRSKERAIEVEHDFEDYVRAQPLKSTLIAAGVGAGLGLVFGVLLARR